MGLVRVVVVDFEDLLDLLKFLLGLRNSPPELVTALLFGDVFVACFVLERAKVLYLFARVLYFGKAERSRRALEEVAQLAELLEVAIVALLPAGLSASVSAGAGSWDARRGTHRLLSIFLNVLSAWPKKS